MKLMIKKALIFLGTLLAYVCFTVTHAASFDCERAQTDTEKTICEHRILNDADVKMAVSYSILRRLVPMGTRSVIQDDQVKWLQFRDRCQVSQQCLSQVYNMRQQQLDLQLEKIYRKGPF